MELPSEYIMLTQSHLHRSIQLSLIVAAGCFLMQPASAQVGLGLSPMRAEHHLAAGQTYTGVLRLVNEGGDIRSRTSVLDFHLDPEQTPQFEDQLPEEAAYSCRSWLSVNPMEVELKNHADTRVRYTLRVPADAKPKSYYCAIGFTSLSPASSASPMGIKTAVRVVAAIYVIVGSPTVQGTLAEIKVEPAPGGKEMRAVVVVENAGTMYFRPSGKIEFIAADGQTLETREIPPVPILPERKQRLVFPLTPAVQGQSFTMRVRADLGTGEIQEGRAQVTLQPKDQPEQ